MFYGIAMALTCSLPTLKAQNLYVANGYDGYEGNNIGEYQLNGSTVNASLISSGLDDPNGIAISGNDLFVVNQFNSTIGEYTTSGATVNASLITGLNGDPWNVAISGNDLFVANYTGTIGEYTA